MIATVTMSNSVIYKNSKRFKNIYKNSKRINGKLPNNNNSIFGVHCFLSIFAAYILYQLFYLYNYSLGWAHRPAYIYIYDLIYLGWAHSPAYIYIYLWFEKWFDMFGLNTPPCMYIYLLFWKWFDMLRVEHRHAYCIRFTANWKWSNHRGIIYFMFERVDPTAPLPSANLYILLFENDKLKKIYLFYVLKMDVTNRTICDSVCFSTNHK